MKMNVLKDIIMSEHPSVLLIVDQIMELRCPNRASVVFKKLQNSLRLLDGDYPSRKS